MEKNIQNFTITLSDSSEEIIFFETGWKAKQANGSVWMKQGGTVVLVTAAGKKTASENQGFFSLLLLTI